MSWLWWSGQDPGDVPEWAYLYLVPVLKADSNSLSQLKSVRQLSFVGDTPAILIRIFDPLIAGKVVRVKDFASLDGHPELILYEGFMEKESRKVHMVRGLASGLENSCPDAGGMKTE